MSFPGHALYSSVSRSWQGWTVGYVAPYSVHLLNSTALNESYLKGGHKSFQDTFETNVRGQRHLCNTYGHEQRLFNITRTQKNNSKNPEWEGLGECVGENLGEVNFTHGSLFPSNGVWWTGQPHLKG